MQKRLQSSCDELSEKNNEYISAQNHAPEVASREEEVYQQYTQKDEGLLQVMVKTTDAIDKIWCLIEKAQRKEKVESKLSSNQVETQSIRINKRNLSYPKVRCPPSMGIP